MSRRQVLTLGGLGAVAAALGACGLGRDGTDEAEESGDGEALAPRRLTYGEHPAQAADLYLPLAEPADAPPRRDGLAPVVALLHGGFWQAGYDLTLMQALAGDLVARGWAVLNVEHRKVGQEGGGWPGTFEDVAAALDLLADGEAVGDVVDPGRVITVGHSAGGQLALWAAARGGLAPGEPGARPAVVPVGAVGQAAVCDLVRGAQEQLGAGACADLLGGSPTEVPDRYEVASPLARLPLGVPQVLVHSEQDDLVPVDQSTAYAAAAADAGDDVEVVLVPGDHFAHLDPFSPAWRAVLDRLPNLLPVA